MNTSVLRRRRRSSKLKSDSPASISGLSGWWDFELSNVSVETNGTGGIPSDGTVFGRLTDLTNNSFHLTADSDAARGDYYTNALLLGKPAGYFIGTTERLINRAICALLGGNPPSYTVFVVARQRRPASHATSGVIWGVMTNGGTLAGNPNIYLADFEDLTVATVPKLRLARRIAGNNVNSDTNVGWGGTAGWTFYTTVVNGDSGRNVYQNGKLVSWASNDPSALTIGNMPFTDQDYFGIGTLFNGVSTQLNSTAMHFFAACVYNRVLTDSEISRLNKYYAKRLSLAPYIHNATFTPLWAFGDSHIEGNNGIAVSVTNNVGTGVRKLQQTLPWNATGKCIFRALGGARMGVSGTAPNDIAEYYDTAKTLVTSGSFGILEGGSNDANEANCPSTGSAPVNNAQAEEMINFEIFGEGTGADTLNFKTIVNDFIETRGGNLILLTSPPRGNMTDPRDYALNYMARKQIEYVSRFDRSAYYDWFSDLVNVGTNKLNETLYESLEDDEIHLNNIAHDLVRNRTVPCYNHLLINPISYSPAIYWTARQGSRFSNGGAIGGTTLLDTSGNGKHASQGTAGARPVWTTDVYNSRPAAVFDGINDFLQFTSTNLTEWTIFFAVAPGASDTNLLGSSSTATDISVSDNRVYIISDTDIAIDWENLVISDFDILTITSAGELYQNGQLQTVTTDEGFSGGHTITIDQIGNFGSSFFNGSIGDILIFNSVLSSTNRNIQERFLGYKYGKTII